MVNTINGARVAHPHITKVGVLQHAPIRKPRLLQDLLSVRNEQQPVFAVCLLREQLIVESRNDSLACASGGHDKVALDPSFANGAKPVQNLLLVRQNGVFAQHISCNLGRSDSLQLLVELVNAAHTKVFKVVAVPIYVKRSKCSIYNVRIFNVRNTNVPFQTICLRRL